MNLKRLTRSYGEKFEQQPSKA